MGVDNCHTSTKKNPENSNWKKYIIMVQNIDKYILKQNSMM